MRRRRGPEPGRSAHMVPAGGQRGPCPVPQEEDPIASKKQPIVHEIRDGFCITCGSNTEFFACIGQSMVDADIREPVMVDPALVEEAFGRLGV